MAALRLAALLGLVPALAYRRAALEQTPAKKYPVTGVVELLQDMQKDLEKQADADEEVYDKLACWCSTNDKGKTEAIAAATTRISDLDSTITRTDALSETLKVEIKSLDEEVAKNKESLEQATALRKKQKAEFVAEEKEMVQSISALGAAITVLSKHHSGGASLLSGEALQMAAKAAGRLQQHTSLLEGRLTPKQKRAVKALAQQGQTVSKGDYLDASPTFKQAYQPQSGEIFGILREMKATFESDLSSSQKEEIQNQQTYEEVKEAKENEIQMGEASSRDKKQQLAEADEKAAQARQDREDTEAALAADKKFLTELKLKCQMTDKEWEDRKQARQDELAAIAEAIQILTSDDARDLFSKTYNFLQMQRSRQVSVREKAATTLLDAARKFKNSQLAALAFSTRLDAFERVKKAIDDMVEQLTKEKGLEIKHRDWCIEEFAKNDRSTQKQEHTKANLETKIEGLGLAIADVNSTINTLKSEIADLVEQKKRAGEDRELEHKEFEATLADQKSSRALLQEAYDHLEKIYASEPAEFIQKRKQQPAMPEGFGKMEKHAGGKGVLALIDHIIQDTKTMEADLTQAEQDAQDAFTALVQETTDSVSAKEDAILDRTQELTGKEQELIDAKGEYDGTLTELETLSEDKGALHKSCDFLLKNFDTRQEARDEEVAALRQAKAYLSGMQF